MPSEDQESSSSQPPVVYGPGTRSVTALTSKPTPHPIPQKPPAPSPPTPFVHTRRCDPGEQIHLDGPYRKTNLARISKRPNTPSRETYASPRPIAGISTPSHSYRNGPRRHAIRQSSGWVATRPGSRLSGRIPSSQPEIR